MLKEYINNYVKAHLKNDTKEMKRIEKDLATLGMDKYTLEILATDQIVKIRKENVK